MKRQEIPILVQEILDGVDLKQALLPELRALPQEDYYLLALGKAAFRMAEIALSALGPSIKRGLVLTKYGHAKGTLPRIVLHESGHPLPDENSLKAGKLAVDFVSSLPEEGCLLFLLSGGGSALMEWPLEGVSLSDLEELTQDLLRKGADIEEMNTLRKHLSRVKGGRLSSHLRGQTIYSFLVSDVLGDRLDMVASGPMTPDHSTSKEALAIAKKYELPLTDQMEEALRQETVKEIPNLREKLVQNIDSLVESTAKAVAQFGYQPWIVSRDLTGEAREAGARMARRGKQILAGETDYQPPCALIYGGETLVTVKGEGKGGRNTELALAGLMELAGEKRLSLLTLASDGTDGPTDGAGAFVDQYTWEKAVQLQVPLEEELADNNSYCVMEELDSLIQTGPTGNNLNDVYVLFVD